MDILDRVKDIVTGIDAVIVELGACDGHHTLLLSQILNSEAKSHRLLAVEPYERIMECAKDHCKEIEVDLIQAAIGDHNGVVDFWVSESVVPDEVGYYGSSSIHKPTGILDEYPKMRFGTPVQVEMITLDKLFLTKSLGHIDFIWADLQGAERELVLGGLNVALPRTQYLYTEYSWGGLYENDTHIDEVYKLLPDWEVVEDYQGDILLRNTKF